MRMKILILSILILFSCFDLCSQQTNTDLRGQIVTYNNYTQSQVPVPNIKVAIIKYDYQSQRWRTLRYTYTNSYGMYYIYNIRYGVYQIQVADKYYYPITVVIIDKRYQQFQDIPRIQI